MICPVCERVCGDSEESCLRCHTPLRVAPPEKVSAAPTRSLSWLWILLALLVVATFVKTCSRLVGGEPPRRVAVAATGPVDEATAYRDGFIRSFRVSCLKRGNPADFCDCAGPMLVDQFKPEEIESVVESTKNGKPDPRMSTIILKCSP